jgi:chemotaxis protein CheD
MLRCDGKRERIVAKIAGGASMFPTMDTLQIGEKNAEVVKKALKTERIRLMAEDIGGKCGRTVTLDTRTGDLSVKTKDEIRVI